MRCEEVIGDVNRSVRFSRTEYEPMSSKPPSDVWPFVSDRGNEYDL